MSYVLANGSTVQKYPYSLTDLRLQNKDVSWPRYITNELASEFNVFPVVETEPPSYSKMTQKLVEGDPINLQGSWVQQWLVVDKTPEEIADDFKTQWGVVRDQRNGLLSSCDWTQLPDVTISNKTEWTSYRQSLRDITDQEDPYNIVWPVNPDEIANEVL